MANVFGLIVSGRLVQTNFTMLSETQFLMNIPEADNINHVVVFLTGASPLPPGLVGMVYWSWPDPSAPQQWQRLGHISNNKPSAIFKISGLKKLHELSNSNQFSDAFGTPKISHEAQVGIAIEPEANAQALADSVAKEAEECLSFAERLVESALNFVASYAVSQEQMSPTPGVLYAPLSALHSWHQTFTRRLRQNPTYWKTM